ncbi:homeobox protein goosecoid-2 isoform X2 [Orcinus orca]|uniref:homeobox protein goosecoid-2 isoform X2 n=1 Tax=Orcinus orca TaxID=9733 RepID=UPI002111F16F|nr:homeobox protein goosecoid-2 isoform X2 [Orcinus orca]
MRPGGPPASPLMAPPSPPLMACLAISSPAICFQSWTQPVLRPRPRLLKSPPVRKDPATLWRVFVGLMPLILCKGSQRKPGSSFNTPAGHLRSYIICLTRRATTVAAEAGARGALALGRTHRGLRGAARRGRPWSTAAHAAPPHHLQRGAAAGAGSALRAKPVPRRGHSRAPGRPHSLARRARGGLVQEPPGQVATPEAHIGIREAPAGSQEAPEGELLTAAELLLGSVAPYGAGSGRGQTYPNRSWERTPASNLVSAQLPASWSSTREPLCVCPRATRPAEGERTDAPCSMRLPSQAQAGRRAGETRGWGAGHRADQFPQSPTTPQEAPSHPRTGATPCQQWHPASSSPPTSCWPQSSPQQGRSPLDWPRTLQRLGGWGLCVLGLVPGAWAS